MPHMHAWNIYGSTIIIKPIYGSYNVSFDKIDYTIIQMGRDVANYIMREERPNYYDFNVSLHDCCMFYLENSHSLLVEY